MKNLFKILFVLSMLLGCGFTASYKIPDVRLEILEKSFRISIPDEPGIKIVAFNVNRNRRFRSFTQGEFSAQVRESDNRRWAAEFRRQLSPDDVIYVWTNVQHNQVVYRDISEPIRVCTLDPLRCQNQDNDNDGDGENNNGDSNGQSIPSNSGSTTTWQTQTLSTTTTQRTSATTEIKDCESTVTEVPYRSVCRGELIFEDNFDTFNASKWMHEVRAPLDTGDAEFMLYDGNVQIKNGQLEIKPMQWASYKPDIDVRYGHFDLGTRCTGTHDRSKECRLVTGGQRILPPVVAPRINTRDSFSFKYGRVEIRAKLPKGDWLIPMLLLEPLTEYYGQTGYESGQLRVAFARGNEHLELSNGKTIDGRILYGGATLFLDADRRDEFMASTRRNFHFGDDYHIYSLIWTPEQLVLEVDNQIYGQIPGGFSGVSANDALLLNAWKRGGYMAPFDRAFYITLGLSVGGFGDYSDNLRSGKKSKPWLNKHPKAQFNFWDHQQDWLPTWQNPELLVDYVRVYAL